MIGCLNWKLQRTKFSNSKTSQYFYRFHCTRWFGFRNDAARSIIFGIIRFRRKTTRTSWSQSRPRSNNTKAWTSPQKLPLATSSNCYFGCTTRSTYECSRETRLRWVVHCRPGPDKHQSHEIFERVSHYVSKFFSKQLFQASQYSMPVNLSMDKLRTNCTIYCYTIKGLSSNWYRFDVFGLEAAFMSNYPRYILFRIHKVKKCVV